MDGAAEPRTLREDAAEHLQFKQDFLMVFGDFAGGPEAFVNHFHAAFAALFHGPLQDASHKVSVSTVHLYSLFIETLTNRKQINLSFTIAPIIRMA